MSFLRPISVLLAVLTTISTLPCKILFAAEVQGDDSQEFAKKVAPLLNTYCYQCHDGSHSDTSLDLTQFTSDADFEKHFHLWQNVERKLKSREMPPSDELQPSPAEYERIVVWVQQRMRRFAAETAGDPGPVVLRRLTNAEYDNTIRDLTGVDLRPAREFPETGSAGEGFSNVGDALSMSPELWEKYLEAAEKVATHTLLMPDGEIRFAEVPVDTEIARTEWAERRLQKFYRRHNFSDRIASPEEIERTRLGLPHYILYFRNDEELRDRVSATDLEELNRLWSELYFLSAEPVRLMESFKYWYQDVLAHSDPQQNYNRIKSLTGAEMEQAIHKGYEQIAIITSAQYVAADAATAVQLFRDCERRLNAFVERKRALQPIYLNSIQEFAKRAWRRPLHAEEGAELSRYFEASLAESLPVEEAARRTLVRILASPNFLYRAERWPQESTPQPVSAVELATRLSYFLWSSMPDAELSSVAESGKLTDTAVLETQVARMLAHSRSRGLAEQFFGQWLKFDRFDRFTGPDPDRFPEFTPELRQAMYDEPVTFFEDLIRRDGSVLEIIEGEHSFLNEALARHYGIEEIEGPMLNRADNLAAKYRGGVLGMGYMLTKFSEPLRTSPVRRGNWVLVTLLGDRLPPTPAEVPQLPEDEAATEGQTIREHLRQHRENKSCASCHDKFDALGVALENFGPLGTYRTRDQGGRSIDASAELTADDGRLIAGWDGLRDYLSQPKQQDRFVQNTSTKIIGYALGRELRPSDDALIEKATEQLRQNDNKLSALVKTIVLSPQFQNHRGRPVDSTTSLQIAPPTK